MIEVEIRAHIDNLPKLKKNLREINARLISKKQQTDRIFGRDDFLDANKMVIEGGFIARIRTNDNKSILEFKEIRRNGIALELSSALHDIDAGCKFLQKLGFREAFTVSKKRTSYRYKDVIICLDAVDQLGDFIEIEKTVSKSALTKQARQECIQLLNEIMPNAKLETRKYGDLIQEMMNKKIQK
ncbi:MAG: class IV adenylate cyclase [Patescibacteria group bacterium]|nr:class IV adenylate cyclase [Patescibacteria group bacterium]